MREAKQRTVDGTGPSLQATFDPDPPSPPMAKKDNGDSFPPLTAPGPRRPVKHSHSWAQAPGSWRGRWVLSEAKEPGW